MKKKFLKLLSFALPAAYQPKPMLDQEQLNALARISDNDPTYRAIIERAHAQFELEVKGCFVNTLTPDQRTLQCGRAGMLHSFLVELEADRQAAKDGVEQEARREALRKKAA